MEDVIVLSFPIPGSAATTGFVLAAIALIAIIRVVMRLVKLLPFF